MGQTNLGIVCNDLCLAMVGGGLKGTIGMPLVIMLEHTTNVYVLQWIRMGRCSESHCLSHVHITCRCVLKDKLNVPLSTLHDLMCLAIG